MADPLVRVVVVDDAPDVRAIIILGLKRSGRFAVVGEGGTGREAVDHVLRLDPDLLLLDVSMPDMDGLEALQLVQAQSPETKVVMFSGFASEDLAARALELGASAFIEKSLAISQLPQRLLDVIGVAGVDDRDAARAADDLDLESAGVLSEHLDRFRDLFDRTAIGMATMTLSGSLIRCNPAFADLAGVDSRVLVGAAYAAIADPVGGAALLAAMADLVEGQQPIATIEHGIAATDTWVLSTIAPVRDSNGQLLYFFLQVQDLSSHRQAMEALGASEERFRLLVEAVSDYAIFMLDTEGHVASWNTGAQRIKGYTADEILGQHFRVFYTDYDRNRRHPEHELEVAAREGRFEEEGWRLRKDGSRFWANVVITALHDADGRLTGFGKVTRDITDRRMLAQERERVAAELAEANTQLRDIAAQKAEVLAVAAHELRSPIVSISGAADLLAGDWEATDPGERKELLQVLERSTGQLRRLLDDLLTATRLDEHAIEYEVARVPLRPLLIEAAGVIAAAIEVSVNVDDDLAVTTDRGRALQIFANLLENAATYGLPPVSVSAAAMPEGVVVRIRDHGQGVPEALAPRLFERYDRGHNRGGGATGWGLFIGRQRARGQGGDAWYEDADPGACFCVRLPKAGR